MHADRVHREPEQRRRPRVRAVHEPVGEHEQREVLARLDGAHLDVLVGEEPLDPIEVDAQPEHLREPVAAADDLVQAVGAASREVAGAQLADRAPRGEVGGLLGVAHHDVRALVHEFADIALG